MALGVLLAALTSDGISYESPGALLLAVVILSFFNVILKPALIFLALPFVILSLGTGILFINALLFYFAGKLVGGFEVAGFWSALWGALIVSLTHLIVTVFLYDRRDRSREQTFVIRHKKGARDTGDDVIDI